MVLLSETVPLAEGAVVIGAEVDVAAPEADVLIPLAEPLALPEPLPLPLP